MTNQMEHTHFNDPCGESPKGSFDASSDASSDEAGDLLFEILKNDASLNSLITEVSEKLKENETWIKSQVYYDIFTAVLADKAGSPYDQVKNQYIKEVIEQGKLGWNHKSFYVYLSKQQEQDDYLLNPFEVEEGVVQCPRCQSFKVYSYSMQLRSADEPMTTIAQCTQCKYKWSQNG